MTIRRLRLIAFLGFLLLIVCSVAATFAALQTQRADALVINLAGRQRMLIQKMTLEVLGVQADADPLYRQQLRETEIVYFEQTLAALIAGGQAPHNEEMSVTLPPTRDPEILAQLETVRAAWEEMDQSIHAALAAEPRSAEMNEAVDTVMRLSPVILAQMDEAVRLYEAEASRKVALAQALQIGFLGVAVALLFTVLFLTERWLLLPIDQLGGAAQRIGEGDLDTPLSIAGPREIKRLAGSFDDMRQNLAASREEQARLYAQAQERLERISALHDIDVAIMSQLDLEKRLEVLLEKVVERLRVDAAAVALIDPHTHKLNYAARRGLNGEFFADGYLKVKDGIAGRVAHSGEAVAIPDVRAEPRFLRREIAGRLGIVSYVAVPLKARGAIIGVLELAARARHEFLAEEMDFFVTLAGQAAIAIENSRLYDAIRQQLQELTTLNAIAAICAGATDEDELLEHATRVVGDVFRADEFGVMLLAETEAGPALWAHPSYRAGEEAKARAVPIPITQGITGRVAATGQPWRVADVSREPQYLAFYPETRSELCVPLKVGGRVIGVINAESARPDAFSEADERLLTTCAGQLAATLERLRAEAALRASETQYRALFENVPVGVYRSAPDGRLLTVNPALVRLLGYDSEEELLALDDARDLYVNPEKREDWKRDVETNGEVRNAEIVLRRKDGRQVVALDSARAVRGEGGETLRYEGTVIDVTSRKQAEEEARLLQTIVLAIAEAGDLHDALSVTLRLVCEATGWIMGEAWTPRADGSCLELSPAWHSAAPELEAFREASRGFTFAPGSGLPGRVWSAKRPAWVQDVTRDDNFPRAPQALRDGLKAAMGIPVMDRDEVVAVMDFFVSEAREEDERQLHLISAVAAQLGMVIRRKRAEEESHRRAAQQHALAESASRILGTLEREALWHMVTTAVRETLAADRAAVYLYDPITDRLTCPHASSLSDEYVAGINRRFHELPGGRLLADPRPVVIADAQTDPATAPIHDLIIRENFHSYAVFPLTAPEGPLGALAAYRDPVAPFSPNDIDAGQMLAHVAAVAMQNARLFEAEHAARKHAETLQQVGTLLTAQLSLDEVFERLFDLLARVVAYDSVSVQLMDNDGKTYLAAGRGFPDMDEARRVVGDIHEMAADKQRRWAEGRPMVIPDTHADSDWIVAPGVEYIRSWVGAPLLVKGNLIGILNVDSRSAGAYDPAAGETVMAFANQAAVAIKNARLFESLINEQHNTARLYHLSLELTTNLDPEDVAKRALQAATDALGVSRGNILTVENDSENMRLLAVTGYDRETVNAINRRLNWNTSRGVTGRVIQTRAAAIVPDVSLDPFWVPIPGLDDWVKSMLSVPLVAGNDIVGVLNLLSEQPGFFKIENLSRIAAIASPVALALQNARLFEAERIAREQAESLREAAEAVGGTLDLDEALRQILTQLKRMLPYDTASVLLLGEGDRPALVIGTGYADERQTSQSAGGLLADSRILRQMALDLQPALIADVRHHPDWIWVAGAGHVRAFLAVPIVARSRLIGALMIDSVQVGFFNESQVYLAQTLAQHMAIAIENARHYEDMRQRLKELEIIANTSSSLRKAQFYSDIAPILLARAVDGLNANAGVLLLLENNALKFSAVHGEINVAVGEICPPDDSGMIWQALESGKPLFIPDISQIEELPKSAVCQSLMGDALSCACVSLQTTTSAIGVVFLNWKKKSFLSADESRLLESLAEIAANAIYRTTLHLQTVRQAQDLTLAYDATIEGWSRALDLRDKETEDHTLRVTNLTLQLAQALGAGDSELKHIRRGALLHDIGKMGVPDRILHKPGALSDEEWAMMRRHPQSAYEMLSPIAYLQPALDIPHCHHEKWDGSGYPRGLKGEEIPLAARIFAVVDVFDALTSDRPYRPAWTKRKAIAYIRQQAGLHFDPKIAAAFMKLIGKKERKQTSRPGGQTLPNGENGHTDK